MIDEDMIQKLILRVHALTMRAETNCGSGRVQRVERVSKGPSAIHTV